MLLRGHDCIAHLIDDPFVCLRSTKANLAHSKHWPPKRKRSVPLSFSFHCLLRTPFW